MPTKPKANYTKEKEKKTHPKDHCQTHPMALAPILPFLDKRWKIWEPCNGKGYITSHLRSLGFTVFASDIERNPETYKTANILHLREMGYEVTGAMLGLNDPELSDLPFVSDLYQDCVGCPPDELIDFMSVTPAFIQDREIDCIVTNFPFSEKYKMLAHIYRLNVRFAVIAPTDMAGAKGGQEPFEAYGAEIINTRPRPNFEMPDMGFEGNGAQMPTSWFTYNLGIGSPLNTYDFKTGKFTRIRSYVARDMIGYHNPMEQFNSPKS